MAEQLNCNTISNIHLHVHTDASFMKDLQGDGAMGVGDLIARAKELGARAMGISDHGVCTNWIPFYLQCKAEGINPVLSVEAYIVNAELFQGVPELEGKVVRMHELIGGYDYAGYQGLCRFVTKTNGNMDSRKFPCGTEEMLREEFGPDAPAHGHVFMTTACISGPVATELAFNRKLDREIAKMRKRLAKAAEVLPGGYWEHAKKVARVTEANAKKDELAAQISFLEPFGKKTCEGRLENPGQWGLADDYALKDVKAKVAELKAEKKAVLASVDDIRKDVSDSSNKSRFATVGKNLSRIAELEAAKKTPEQLLDDAETALRKLIDIFGKENVYAEIQYHGFDGEYELYRGTVEVARRCGVKLIAANDAHMARREDFHKRELMVNLGKLSNQGAEWEPLEDADRELYLKDDDEMREALARLDLAEEDIDEAMASLVEVTDRCHLEIPKEPHYPVVPDAENDLRRRCEEGIPKCYPNGFPDEYRKRMEYELGVILKMGYASYFCEVAEYIEFAKNSDVNSIEIGPGRGSGAGSIVCYLTGITTIDPMRFGLMFERFLNPDRVSLPDIDTDFSAHARAVTVDHVTELYGQSVKIQTKTFQGGKGALDYGSKLYALQQKLPRNTYAGLVKELKEAFDAAFEAAEDQKHFNLKAWKPAFLGTFGGNAEAVAILDEASLIEGMMTGTGLHAAGQVMADERIENFIPLAKTVDDETGKEVWVIQADMVECEGNLGFIKMDFLGLKNLNIITDCQRMMTRFNAEYDPARGGKYLDAYELIEEDMLDPKVFSEIYATGDTNFVFQFESAGMKKMLKAFRPDCLEDIILLVAAYRPGPMQFIEPMTETKHTGKKSPLVAAIPELEPILKETYGYPIYQEQIMRICTDLAGYSLSQADNVRKYMSKKKTALLKAEKQAFVYGDPERLDAKGNPAPIKGCVANGIDANAAEDLWDKLEDFGKYAFNKAHAAAYAVVSYITAWLKLHNFREYICAAIRTQDDKQDQLSVDCKMRGVHVFAPDINISEANYVLYRDGIIPGIGSIKGFDKIAGQIVAERAENGEYTSIYNIIDRCPFLDSKDIDTLVRSGACDPLLASFAGNRDTASENAKLYKSTIGELADAEDKLAEWKAKPSETEKDAKANAKGTKTYTDRIAEISKRLDMIRQTKNQTPMSTVKRLAYESELLGLWVTGNPLDDYNLDNGKYNLVEDIESMEERTRVTVAGFITDVKKIYTKKDGHAMCVFTLVDQNGSRIRGIAFPSAYDSCGKDIKNNSVIELKGQVTLDNRTKDGEDPERQISVNAIAPLVENRQLLIVDARSMEEMADVIRPLLDRCSTKSGTQVKIHERSTNTMFLYQLAVDAERCGQMLQQSRLSYAFA